MSRGGFGCAVTSGARVHPRSLSETSYCGHKGCGQQRKGIGLEQQVRSRFLHCDQPWGDRAEELLFLKVTED